MGSGLLKGRTDRNQDLTGIVFTEKQTISHLVHSTRDVPVRHRRGDVSIIESGMPRKQDNASVAKYTVEEELRREQKGEKLKS